MENEPLCSRGPWERIDLGVSQVGIRAPLMKHTDGADIAKVYVNPPRKKGRSAEFVGNMQIIEAAWEMLDALQKVARVTPDAEGDYIMFADENGKNSLMAAVVAAVAKATEGWPDEMRRLPVSQHGG